VLQRGAVCYIVPKDSISKASECDVCVIVSECVCVCVCVCACVCGVKHSVEKTSVIIGRRFARWNSLRHDIKHRKQRLQGSIEPHLEHRNDQGKVAIF